MAAALNEQTSDVVVTYGPFKTPYMVPAAVVAVCKALHSPPSKDDVGEEDKEDKTGKEDIVHIPVVQDMNTLDMVVRYCEMQKGGGATVSHWEKSKDDYVWPLTLELRNRNPQSRIFFNDLRRRGMQQEKELKEEERKTDWEYSLILISLLQACNFLEYEDLMMESAMEAASLIVGRGWYTGADDFKQKIYEQFKTDLPNDLLFVLDHFLPFEDQPLLPLEDKRMFMRGWLEKQELKFVPELTYWTTATLHRLCVDIQHYLWRKHNYKPQQMLCGAFTKYNSAAVDQWVIAQLFACETEPQMAYEHQLHRINEMMMRHTECHHFERVVALDAEIVECEAKRVAATPEVVNEGLRPLRDRTWWIGQELFRKREPSLNAWPLVNQLVPRLEICPDATDTCGAIGELAILQGVKMGDLWLLLKGYELLLNRTAHFTTLTVNTVAVNGDVQMADMFASFLELPQASWNNKLWGTFHHGDETGLALQQFVLSQESFWTSPTARADIRHTIHIDARGPEFAQRRGMLLEALKKREWLAEFEEALKVEEWVERAEEAQGSSEEEQEEEINGLGPGQRN